MGGNLFAVFPTIAPALLCVIADYIGLGAITPALPYHLADKTTLSSKQVASWVGAISSSQFGAVVLACIFWGRVCDVRGARFALLCTMLGDTLFFSLTALGEDPAILLAFRLGAGFFSPLVPALAYVFEKVPPKNLFDGITWYTLSVVMGLACGSSVAAIYEPLGWVAFSLVIGGIAAVAAAVGAVYLKPRPPSTGGKAKPEGVLQAMKTGDYISCVLTSFAVGWDLNLYLQVTAVMLFELYNFTPGQSSLIFLGSMSAPRRALPLCRYSTLTVLYRYLAGQYR